MYSPDNSRYFGSLSHCLTYCSINRTCLTVMYSITTSTCYTSGNTDVVLIENLITTDKVFMKRAAMLLANVYENKTGQARS